MKINEMKKYSNVVLITLLFVVTFLFLQGFNAFHFYYIEQFQLFLTTPLYFFDSISHPGGLIEYFSHFLVQFFIVPYCGAIIETITLILVFIATSRLIFRSGRSKNIIIAPASIFLSCLLMCFNFNIFFQGVLSYLLCLFCLNAFISKRNTIIRNISVFISVPLLYWIAGSVSLLFAVCFCLYELFNEKNKKRFYWFLLPAFAILISWLSLRFSLTGNFRVSFLPDMYYQPKLTPSFVIYIPWLLLLFWIPVIVFIARVNFITKKHYLTLGIQSLLFLLLLGIGIKKYGDLESYKVKKLDYYARVEQWDKIIAECKKGEIDNYLAMNYLNLALNQKGLLLEKMFQFNQNGPLCLEVPSKKKNTVAPLLSDISFSVGDIASSQRYAFEGYETCPGGGSGRLLKRLIQTNLIYGEFAVAEKYIRILEHTFFYHKWASTQRQFLYNDSLCLKDPLISEKRKFLPAKGSRGFVTVFPETLKTLIEINPSNKSARDYFFAYLLLSKDMKLFSGFFPQFKQNGMLPSPLPAPVQQALLMCYESQPETWEENGISEAIINHYRRYKSVYMKTRRNPGKKEIMEKEFASTYWYYFQFINI